MTAKELKQRRLDCRLTQKQLSQLSRVPHSVISQLERHLYPQQPLVGAAIDRLKEVLSPEWGTLPQVG